MKASSSSSPNTKESPVQHDNPTTSSSLDTPSTSTNSASSPALDHLTITQFSQLSTKTKTGYLYFQKSSSIFTRWKRKYFLLNGNYLRRYTSPDDIEKDEIINYKEFVLTWKSMVISTDIDTCFILKTPPLSDDEGGGQGTAAGTISWTLKCDSPNETKEWMIYLSSHIHGLFLLHRPDLAEIDLTKYEKFTSHTFWILPTSNSAGPVINPVGIRSLPDQYGPRTGEGIYPGEIFEVVQLIHSPTGVIYLRLADDRGWVFDKHPSGGYDLIIQLQPHEYKYQEKSLTLIANNDQASIPVLINPSLASPLTKLTIQGGEECLVHGLLTMTMSASAAIPTPNSRGSSSSMASASQNDQSGLNEIDFAKLRDGRGWIAIKSSSGELLFKSLRKRGDSQTLQSQSSNEIRGVQGNSMYRKKVSL